MASNTESKYISCHPHSTIFFNESQQFFPINKQKINPEETVEFYFVFRSNFLCEFLQPFWEFLLGMVKRRKKFFFVCLFFSSTLWCCCCYCSSLDGCFENVEEILHSPGARNKKVLVPLNSQFDRSFMNFLKSRKSLASGVYKQAPSPTTKHAQIFPKKDFSSLLFFCWDVVFFLYAKKFPIIIIWIPHFPSSHLFIHFSLVYSMLHSSVCLLRAFPVFYSFVRYVLSGKQNLQKNKWKSVLKE